MIFLVVTVALAAAATDDAITFWLAHCVFLLFQLLFLLDLIFLCAAPKKKEKFHTNSIPDAIK